MGKIVQRKNDIEEWRSNFAFSGRPFHDRYQVEVSASRRSRSKFQKREWVETVGTIVSG